MKSFQLMRWLAQCGMACSALAMLAATTPAEGQTCCGPDWQLETICESRHVTNYRWESETIYEEQTVRSVRPVWKTEMRERRYRVATPIKETATRQEKYTVLRPVTETVYRDESYDRVRWVTETSSREERRTVYRPVTETQEREERVVVQRPVTETAAYDRVDTNWVPVTAYRPQLVDRGGVMDQWTVTPQRPRSRLRWLPRSEYYDPRTGQVESQRAGFYWVPEVARGRYEVQRVYVPNYQSVPVPETTYVPQQVTRRVEVPVTRYREEIEVRKVPVTVSKMVPQEERRTVPVTVQRPVTERVTRQVPVDVTRWVSEEKVREIPVTSYRWKYEDRVEQKPVRVCRMETVERKIVVPRTRGRWVPYDTVRHVPRQVIVNGNSWATPWSVVTSPSPNSSEPDRVASRRPEIDEFGDGATAGDGSTGGADSNDESPTPLDSTDLSQSDVDQPLDLRPAQGGSLDPEAPPPAPEAQPLDLNQTPNRLR